MSIVANTLQRSGAVAGEPFPDGPGPPGELPTRRTELGASAGTLSTGQSAAMHARWIPVLWGLGRRSPAESGCKTCASLPRRHDKTT
jgi:hypothetical protein